MKTSMQMAWQEFSTRRPREWSWALAAFALCVDAAAAGCAGVEQVHASSATAMEVRAHSPLRTLLPSFFGFSFVWVEFQDSLWVDTSGSVDPEAVQWLRAFPGAVYRYPGGTESNYFDWRAATGPAQGRPSRKAVKWKGPVIAKFGIDEYFRFLESVGGQAWYVVNVFGEYGRETDPTDLSVGAGALAAYLKREKKRVLRWELGNELDRGEYLWPPAKYAAIARGAAEAIARSDSDAGFVATMQDYPSQWRSGIDANAFNRRVAGGLHGIVAEFAQHSYYDGVNIDGPVTVPDRIANLCRTAATAQQAVRPGTAAGIWVTEHARQPVKASKDAEWKPTWYKGSTLEAAVGVADFVIASAQIPAVHGLFVHALHGLDAPWPMFHRIKDTGQLVPSAVYWALRILRETMEPYVLPTVTSSTNAGGYHGGYDVRGVVMANAQRNRWSLWAVNRSAAELTVDVKIQALAGKRARANGWVLSDPDRDANNYVQGSRLRPRSRAFDVEFDAAGRAVVKLPGNAVLGIRLEPVGKL